MVVLPLELTKDDGGVVVLPLELTEEGGGEGRRMGGAREAERERKRTSFLFSFYFIVGLE